ncbi:hypothetical protein [Streptomyces sp. GESEQ-35]|uniref:hypothetical protein n=1 Tax=Streptomyces sp. GESEQ-35 TaxID=2812657 RepID=UPI001B31D1A5|nr:hypothetical protein [Streptomyces sp. GESEQ-35]
MIHLVDKSNHFNVPHFPFREFAEKEAFRRDMMAFFEGDPWVGEYLGQIPSDPVGEKFDFDQLLLFAFGGETAEVADDLLEALMMRRFGNASLWFPSVRHFDLLGIFVKNGLEIRMAEGLLRPVSDLVALDVPGIGGLSVADIVAIRLNSEVFESWRKEIQMTFSILDSLPDGVNREAKLREIKALLESAAERVKAELETAESRGTAGHVKKIGLGTFAGAAAGATTAELMSGGDLLLRIIVGASSGATTAIVNVFGDLLGDRGERRNRKQALDAATAHAMIFS